MSKPNLFSIIITTYNRPNALSLVLAALAEQTDHHFEVVIADDGSDNTTKQLIQYQQSYQAYRVNHVWHEDNGFRAAMIRNKAVAKAKGDYLIFLDGDCVPRNDFVAKHRVLSEKGWFVTGNRILLNETFTHKVEENAIPIFNFKFHKMLLAKLKKQINRVLPMLYVPLGSFRKRKPNQWGGVKTCNLGLWKKDFMGVNGFNENFVGWGFEDSDLVIRLLRTGVKRKEGRLALTVFHLWHPENDRSYEVDNLDRLHNIEVSETTQAQSGISQYVTEH